MASSSSNLVNNLSEEIHRIEFKFGHDDKKCDTCRTKCKYCDCFKCLCCNKNYQHKFDEKLNERLFNAQNFSNYDINKFFFIVA